MPEIMSADSGPGKPTRTLNLTESKTWLFTVEDVERIEQCAQRLAEITHGEPDVPGFVRGTLRRRCEEILGAVA